VFQDEEEPLLEAEEPWTVCEMAIGVAFEVPVRSGGRQVLLLDDVDGDGWVCIHTFLFSSVVRKTVASRRYCL
jgi:hypothetical protein